MEIPALTVIRAGLVNGSITPEARDRSKLPDLERVLLKTIAVLREIQTASIFSLNFSPRVAIDTSSPSDANQSVTAIELTYRTRKIGDSDKRR